MSVSPSAGSGRKAAGSFRERTPSLANVAASDEASAGPTAP
jgi:hypothetical protein